MNVNAKWARGQRERERRKKAYARGDKETMVRYSLIILMDTYTVVRAELNGDLARVLSIRSR